MDIPPRLVRGKDAHRQSIGQRAVFGRRNRRSPGRPLVLQHSHRNLRQMGQDLLLLGVQDARLGVDHAQSAGAEPVVHHQGGAGVKPDVGVGCDRRVFGEPPVHRGVMHLEQVVLPDGMRAERHFARGALNALKTHLRLEPHPVGPGKRNQRNRCPAHQSRRPHQRVKVSVGCVISIVEHTEWLRCCQVAVGQRLLRHRQTFPGRAPGANCQTR